MRLPYDEGVANHIGPERGRARRSDQRYERKVGNAQYGPRSSESARKRPLKRTVAGLSAICAQGLEPPRVYPFLAFVAPTEAAYVRQDAARSSARPDYSTTRWRGGQHVRREQQGTHWRAGGLQSIFQGAASRPGVA